MYSAVSKRRGGVPSQQGCAWPQTGSSRDHTGERGCPSETWTGWRKGLSRTSLNSARASRISSISEGISWSSASCRCCSARGFPPSLENLCPVMCSRQLIMALCNLIYLDLFWAKDQTRYPLKVPSTIHFCSMTVDYLLYSAFCMREDFEECSILKLLV